MGFGSRDLHRLAHDVQDPAMRAARSYLAEALESLRQSDDPVDTLVLLRALWGTGYASRGTQQAALDAVGCWLEQRLRREPGIAVDRLRLEFGWLRRMVVAQQKEDKEARIAHRDEQPAHRAGARHHVRNSGRGPGRKSDEPGFGHDIDHLRDARERALRPAQPHSKSQGEVPVAPTELPEAFAVFFAEIQVVREARRKARKKKRNHSGQGNKDKPARDRLLALRPVDDALVPLARNLACSLLTTRGMDELFAATDARGGVTPSFYLRCDQIVVREGKRIAQQIWLSPPVTTNKE